MYNKILLKYKEKINHCICRKIDITTDHYVQQNKPFSIKMNNLFSQL